MKVINFLMIFFLMVCLVYADDSHLIVAQKVEKISSEMSGFQNSPRKIYQISAILYKYEKHLTHCIDKNRKNLEYLNDEINIMKNSRFNPFINKLYKNNILLTKKYKEELALCRITKYKIYRIHEQIKYYNQDNFLKSFHHRYENFFMTLKKVDFSTFQYFPQGYVLKMLISQSNVLRNMIMLNFILLAFLVLRYMVQIQYISFIKLQDLSLKRYLFVVLLFTFIAPVQYLLLKTGYIHHDELLLDIYKKPSSIMIGLIIFFYLYLYSDREHLIKDIIFILVSVFFQIILVILCFSLIYFDLNNISYTETMFFKYAILFDLQFIIILLFYWLFVKILKVSHFSDWSFKIYLLIALFLFIQGLRGYIDMSINLDLTLIFVSIMLTWTILFSRFRSFLMNKFQNPGKKINNWLHEFYNESYEKLIFFLKLAVNYLYLNFMIQVFALSAVSAIFFHSEDYLDNFYNFIYISQKIGQFKFVLINYIYALGVFFLLNILNITLSCFYAKKFFSDPVQKQKTTQIFYSLGLVIILFICFVVAQIDFQNLMFLFGGLLLGVGFGLKNVLTNLFSSFIIFLNRPFEAGDFISIDKYKGYVNKIGVLETTLKTLDSDTVILPNQFIAQTIIQNYTFDHKAYHKVHFNYLIMDLTQYDEKKMQKIIKRVLEDYEIVKPEDPKYFQFIFSPDTQNTSAYQLELIFTVNTLKHLKRITNDINLKIVEALKNEKIEVRFNGMTHALI